MVCAFLFFTSCNAVTEDMLYGKYVLNEHRQYDTICILQDPKVLEIIKHQDRFYQCSGSWTLKNSRIEFHSFNHCDFSVHYWIGNYYQAGVKKTANGEIRIIYASEEGIYYTKVNE